MRRTFSVLLALAALLLATGCGSSSSSDSSSAKSSSKSSSGKITGVSVAGDFGSVPKVTVKSPLKVKDPQTEVVTKGSGATLASGQQALVHLLLENGTTGKPIGSTYDEGVPTSITLDSSSLPAPLVSALQGQAKGGRVAVAASAADLYGPSGNSSLNLKATDSVVVVFDILALQPADVLSAPKGASKAAPADAPKLVQKGTKISTLDFSKAAKKPSGKLKVIRLVTGTGPKTTKSSLVTMDYIGQVYGSKKPFNNTYTTGKPATFPLGVGGLIKAWDQALVGVPVGSRVMLVAPPGVAYGAAGSPDAGIPKNATLVFVIDVLGVSS